MAKESPVSFRWAESRFRHYSSADLDIVRVKSAADVFEAECAFVLRRFADARDILALDLYERDPNGIVAAELYESQRSSLLDLHLLEQSAGTGRPLGAICPGRR